MAFLLCVGFGGYGVMRKLGSGVVCPLTGRYVYFFIKSKLLIVVENYFS